MRLEPSEVGLQRRRVHRDQHARLVAGRGDVVIADLHLEARHAVDRAGWGADLGRILRQRRQVVAERCADRGESITGQLHAVAGITGEPHDHACDGFGFTPSRALYGVRHGHLLPRAGGLVAVPLSQTLYRLAGNKGDTKQRNEQSDQRQCTKPFTEQHGALHGAQRWCEEEQACDLRRCPALQEPQHQQDGGDRQHDDRPEQGEHRLAGDSEVDSFPRRRPESATRPPQVTYCTTVPHSSGIVEHFLRCTSVPPAIPNTLTADAAHRHHRDARGMGHQSIDDHRDHTRETQSDTDPLQPDQALAEHTSRRQCGEHRMQTRRSTR